MKKTILVLTIASALVACSGNSSSDNQDAATSVENTTESPEQSQSAASGSSEPAGAQLIASSDCLSCHKTDTKLVGPAYTEVAKKYEATEENIKHLVTKIINGGSGVWGEVPMTPHPGLSESDAKEMVTYILSLK